MIGTHTATIGGFDVSCLVDEISLVHGRADTTAQPVASAATISLDLTGDELPGEAEIGAPVTITTDLGAGPVTRFSGRVTDLSLGWVDTGTDTPVSGIAQIMAVGRLADLGRRVIGDEPWPAELDGARVARALALAGVTLDPVQSDPGTVTILPRDVDSQDTLTIVSEVAVSAGGLVWETTGGEIRYADAEHRRNVDRRLALDSCELLVSPVWSRTLQGTTNKVSLGYGVAPEGGEQPRAEAVNAESVARYGIYDYSTTTLLAEADDADAYARLLITRNGFPVWIMPALPIDMASLDGATTADLLALDVGDLLDLTGLPEITPSAPTTTSLWVEGWTERLAWETHELEVVVSGYCRTVPPPRWDDVDPAYTWDDMATPGLGPTALTPRPPTWDDMACLPPLQRHDRWTDLPASQRWDTTDPAATWDNPIEETTP
jgi:hypothetical protein